MHHIRSFIQNLIERIPVGLKVVILAGCLSAVMLSILGWQIYRTQSEQIRGEFEQRALTVAHAVEAATITSTSLEGEQDLLLQLINQQNHIEALVERDPTILGIDVFALGGGGGQEMMVVGSTDRDQLAAAPPQHDVPGLIEVFGDGIESSHEKEVAGENAYHLLVPLDVAGQPPLAIGVALSTASRDDALAAVLRTFVITVIIASAAGLVLLYAVTWVLISRPLKHLGRAADEMRRGDYDARVPGAPSSEARDEIVRLSADFNSMAEAIEGLHDETVALARTDPLTGLNNRRLFLDELQRAVERSRRSGESLAVIMLDLDGFKAVNDRYGHAVGDAALTHIAQALTSAARAGDFTARFGGDEFVVLLPNCDGESLATTMERIRRQIDELAPPHAGDGEDVHITASAGGALLRDEDTVDSLMQRTDLALFEAKDRGRNQVRVAA